MLTPTLNCRVASAACLLILLIFAIDQAHAEPVPFRATYKADYKGLRADIETKAIDFVKKMNALN